MPCSFDANTRLHGRSWRNVSAVHYVLSESNEQFRLLSGVNGGACHRCDNPVYGWGWGSEWHLLCLRCAIHFGGPDLTQTMPQLFNSELDSDDSYEEHQLNLTTKRDKDFDPRKYKPYRHSARLTGTDGCSGYRCPTYAAPYRTIPANALFYLGENNRGHLCEACYNKLKTKWDAIPDTHLCRSCGRHSRYDLHPTAHNGNVCLPCVNQFYMPATETDGQHIRRDGAVWCTYPAQTNADGLLTAPPRRVYASEEWAEAHWFRGRSQWYLDEAAADEELYGADEAYRANSLARDRNMTIFSYGTNIIKLHGFPLAVTKKDDLCFGVELEMQPNRNHQHLDLIAVLGDKWVAGRPYIMCRDSSIGEAGVEFITLPYTLANHKSDKYVEWTKILEQLRKVAQSGANTTACGMHVHINKRALSNLQMGKMLVIVNCPEMQQLIVTIAQRSDTSYARRFYKKVTEGGKIIGSHGDALNMSNNKGTAELRIFRGNLRYERVMKNLEFTEALCLYANEQSIQRIRDPKLFVSWINDHKHHYPHLVKFIDEEYEPTKAFARMAARIAVGQDWQEAASAVQVEPLEGDV